MPSTAEIFPFAKLAESKLVRWVALLSGLGLLGLVAYFSTGKNTSHFWIHTSYFFMWGVFAFWIYSLSLWARIANVYTKFFWETHRLALVIAIAGTILVFIAVPPELRVLSDEANLLNTSRSMAFEHRVDASQMGYWYYNSYWPDHRQVDQRPFFFPFLLSLFHSFLGYQPENVFLLNGLLLFGLLAVVGMQFSHHKIGPIFATLILLSQPVLSITATSGAFDLLALFALVLALFALRLHQNHLTQESLVLLVGQLLVLAYVRYEGPALAAILLLSPTLRPSMARLRSLLILGTLSLALLLPRIWQARNIDLGLAIPKEFKTFSPDHLVANSIALLKTLLIGDMQSPYSAILTVIFLGSLLHLLFLKHTLSSWSKTFFAVISLQLFFFLCYFHGNPNSAAAIRFFLPVSFAIAFFVSWYFLNVQRRSTLELIFGAVFAFSIYFPVAIENRLMNSLVGTREYRTGLSYLNAVNSNNSLIITSRPEWYTAQNYSAINFEFAQNKELFLKTLLRQRLFQTAYVLELVRFKDSNTSLKWQDVSLATVSESQMDGEKLLRISKMVLRE